MAVKQIHSKPCLRLPRFSVRIAAIEFVTARSVDLHIPEWLVVTLYALGSHRIDLLSMAGIGNPAIAASGRLRSHTRSGRTGRLLGGGVGGMIVQNHIEQRLVDP